MSSPRWPGEAEIAARRLFSDQDRFKREGRRRFELIGAHLDVPLNDVAMQ